MCTIIRLLSFTRLMKDSYALKKRMGSFTHEMRASFYLYPQRIESIVSEIAKLESSRIAQ